MNNLSLSAKLIVGFLIATTLILVTAGMSAMSIGRLVEVSTSNPEEFDRAAQSARAMILMTAISGSILCVMLGVLLSRTIALPLQLIRDRIEQLAAGKRPERLQFRADSPCQDDLTKIIQAVNTLIDQQRR